MVEIKMANELEIRQSNEMVAPPASLIEASLKLPPRDMAVIRTSMIAMLTSNSEVARASIYCVPVGKDRETGLQKFTLGESIRMAEVAQGAFGRLMVDIKIEEKNAESVTVKAMALDLQTLNIYPGLGTARIFNQSREKLAIQAAASIARRNAILSMVKPYTQAILPEVKAAIVTGLSESGSIKEALEALEKDFDDLGVTKEQMKSAVKHLPEKVDWVVMLIGIRNGLRDHMYSKEDVFAPESTKPETTAPKSKKDKAEPKAKEKPIEREPGVDDDEPPLPMSPENQEFVNQL
jgi:hypothetical protein